MTIEILIITIKNKTIKKIKIKNLLKKIIKCNFVLSFLIKLKYNKAILFIKEIFLKGVSNLSSYELIWRLIVLLLLSDYNSEDSQKTQD